MFESVLKTQVGKGFNANVRLKRMLAQVPHQDRDALSEKFGAFRNGLFDRQKLAQQEHGHHFTVHVTFLSCQKLIKLVESEELPDFLLSIFRLA